MSFLKITDPHKRDQMVNEYLKTKRNIQMNSLVDKVGDIETRRGYEKIFQPITESQKELIKQTTPILAIEEKPKQLAIEEKTKQSPTNLGEIATHYLSKFANKEGVDKVFGIYNKDNKFFIGDKPIEFDNNDIIIDQSRFKGTSGLWELIVSKDPDDFDEEDYHDYVRLLTKTNAMKQPNSNKPKSSTSKKYKQIIKPIWEGQKQITGSGLIDRFDLLMSSKQAGNTGVKDEMISILKELLNQNVIDSSEYKFLHSKC